MKHYLLAIGATAMIALGGCKEEPVKEETKEVAIDTFEQKVSYTIGLSVAQNINVKDFAFDTAAFNKAVEDVKGDIDPALTDDEMRATMQAFQSAQRELMEAKRKSEGEENLAKGAAFLAENATKEGVVSTESGLQYKVITAGEGEKPAATDTVVAHYRGTLLDGTEFDSSYKRGEPATFAVNRLIPGWTEALQLMPAGSKWELTIPAALAYGENSPPNIPSQSVLQFELELIEVKKEEKAAETK